MENREERIDLIAGVIRKNIEAAGYGSWVRDDQIRAIAEEIQTAIEEHDAERLNSHG